MTTSDAPRNPASLHGKGSPTGVNTPAPASAPGNGSGSSRLTARRFLIIGDAALQKSVRDILFEADIQATLGLAENYLMGLGQMAVEPPAVVIGRTHILEDSAEATAAAMRRLTPEARLILVARPEDESEAVRALTAGFDEYVLDPVDPDELMQAIEEPVALLDDADARKAAMSPEPRGTPVREAPVLSVSPTSLAAPVVPPPMVEAAADELGDVDLVEQVLHEQRGVREMALRMIASRSGVPGLVWSETASQVPLGHAVVPIEFQARKLGFLYAPAPANTVQLGAWAAWLARWLALDQRVQELSDLAMRDELTGVWNRRYFNQFLGKIMDRAAEERFRVTLLVFDIDDFKIYNDRYGHGAGDEILRESARLMQSVVRTNDVVARVGGDEFAVIFWDAEGPRQPNSQHPQNAVDCARRFQRAIVDHRFPKLLKEAPGTLTISGGLASFPWDGRTPEELLTLADVRALQSKRQGKNAITFGPGADHCLIHPGK